MADGGLRLGASKSKACTTHRDRWRKVGGGCENRTHVRSFAGWRHGVLVLANFSYNCTELICSEAIVKFPQTQTKLETTRNLKDKWYPRVVSTFSYAEPDLWRRSFLISPNQETHALGLFEQVVRSHVTIRPGDDRRATLVPDQRGDLGVREPRLTTLCHKETAQPVERHVARLCRTAEVRQFFRERRVRNPRRPSGRFRRPGWATRLRVRRCARRIVRSL